MKKILLTVLLLMSGALAQAATHVSTTTTTTTPLVVKEGITDFKVESFAPIPEEVENESQAKALAREAAVVRGQTALLTYVLAKETRSKRKLSEAEIPSLELQEQIRGYIQGAKVTRTEWGPKNCTVNLSLSKKFLKEILSKN